MNWKSSGLQFEKYLQDLLPRPAEIELVVEVPEDEEHEFPHRCWSKQQQQEQQMNRKQVEAGPHVGRHLPRAPASHGQNVLYFLWVSHRLIAQVCLLRPFSLIRPFCSVDVTQE